MSNRSSKCEVDEYHLCTSLRHENLPNFGCKPSAAFELGSFVRVCDTPPVHLDAESSEDSSSDDESVRETLEKRRSSYKWVSDMNDTCGNVGIVCDGRKRLGVTRVLFEDEFYFYHDEWLKSVADEDVDEPLRDVLQRRYEIVVNRTAHLIFSGESAFHFVQPQYVRVIRPRDMDSARKCNPLSRWTPLMEDTVDKVGMVAGGILRCGITTVLFEDGRFYTYKDEWLRSVTLVVGKSQFLQSDTRPSQQVDSSVWQHMRERYFTQRIKKEKVEKQVRYTSVKKNV